MAGLDGVGGREERDGQGSGEDVIGLLGDPDEGGPAAQFLQLAGAHVGAGGTHTTQDVLHCDTHVTSVLNLNCLPFRGSGRGGGAGEEMRMNGCECV